MAAALWRFWQLRGHSAEGRHRVAELLALPAAEPLVALRAAGLSCAGRLAWFQGDLRGRAGRCSRSRWRSVAQLGDDYGIAYPAAQPGMVALSRGDYPARPARLCGESFTRFNDAGERLGLDHSACTSWPSSSDWRANTPERARAWERRRWATRPLGRRPARRSPTRS